MGASKPVRAVQIAPQPGAQTKFLASEADIALYGGEAGSGKTWALLLETLRHIHNPRFGTVIFRRTFPMIESEGGLWDKASELYPLVDAKPNRGNMFWRFPSGCRVSFGHLQHEQSVLNWQGAEIALLGFDELTHFTAYQFFYLMSRNRSTSGVKPYIRATCNADADSWVADFIAWWIDQDTGLAIPERSGVIRYFVRIEDVIEWGDTREELYQRYPHLQEAREKYGSEVIKSFTFISASLADNPALLEKDPTYIASLMALPLVERERLFGGNWKIRREAGKFINRGWFKIVPAAPAGGIECRGVDFAATARELSGKGTREADWTAMVKIKKVLGRFYVTDYKEEQVSPSESETLLLNTATQDRLIAQAQGADYRVRWGAGKGDAGKRDNNRLMTLMDGFDAAGIEESGDKYERARPFAAQAYAGNVEVVEGAWNEKFLSRLHTLPDGKDDALDATNDAYLGLQDTPPKVGGQSAGVFKINQPKATSRRLRHRPVKRPKGLFQ